jgi:hypothetical protein
MCQWSGEDVCTEFHVLHVRNYLQLICGSVLLMWYVIRSFASRYFVLLYY